MSEPAKFKINLNSGEVDISGSEEFVERQIEKLADLVEALGLSVGSGANEDAEDQDQSSRSDKVGVAASKQGSDAPAGTFGEWLHSFKSEINDLDKALITARFVQSLSPENDFKTSEVNKSLKEHGIRLANPSSSLKRLADKKLMFQTRKVGSLRFMRVSVDGQKHLETLKRQA